VNPSDRLCATWRTVLAASVVFISAAMSSCAPSARLTDVVPDYMEGDLETAIVPTPKQAKLADVCHEVAGPIVCVVPKVVLAARAKLAESKILDLPVGRKRDAALRRLGESMTPTGWPDPVGLAMQIHEILPGAKLVVAAPAAAAGTLVVLTPDGTSPPAGGILPGADLSLPTVKDAKVADEAYVLVSGADSAGRPRVVIRGASAWGMLWGLQTLRQMIFVKGPTRYIRAGRVADWPTLWFRGGKRGHAWWVRFKGNASFEGKQWGFAKQRLRRSHFWWVKGDKKTIEALKTAFRAAVKQGMSIFIIDYNDGAFRTKDGPNEAFPGDPAKTVKLLLDVLDAERTRLKADIRIGYMPSAYSLGHGPRAEGQALRKANALAKADLLVHNGLSVWTFRYPTEAARVYREMFGWKGDLILYDCQCLRKPLDAMDLESREIWKQLSGVSLQNAWFLFAATGLDYAWNPRAYDPQRSLKLAAREWALRDPATYKALWELVSYFNANEFVARYVPRQELLAMEREATAGMISRLDKAKPLLARHSLMPGTAEFLAGSGIVPEIGARPLRRKLFFPVMQKYGFREYRVKRRGGPIAIDGRLDDAAWRAAPAMDRFTTPGYLIRDLKKGGIDKIVALPSQGRSVTAKALYDDTGLYFCFEVHGLSAKALTEARAALAKGPGKPARTPYCWRHGPTIELYFNPAFDHKAYWQLICTVPNEFVTIAFQHFDPADPGYRWRPRPNFRYALTEDNALVLEGKVPYTRKVPRPRKGDVWSVQLQAQKVFDKTVPVVRWSFSYETWSQAPYQRFGRWIFD